MSENVLPIFFLGYLWCHFEFTLHMVWERCEGVIWLHWFICSCPAFLIPLSEETVFSPLFILASFVENNWPQCVEILLGPLFHSIDLYVCFCANTTCFDYCGFEVLSEVWDSYASTFVLFPRDCFGILRSFVFPYKFRVTWSSFMKNVIDNLIGITLNV